MGKALDALKIPYYPAHPSNYTPGRQRALKYFTVHHIAGTPNTLRHLWQDPTRNGSSTFACFPTYIEQYVPISSTSWANGNWNSNNESITVENYGDWRGGYVNNGVLVQLKKLMKACRQDMPNLQLTFHQDVSDKFTECPAQLRAHAQRIWNEVTQELKGGSTPAPAPAPSKITYKAITPKKIELKYAANLWNFNFTDWSKAQAVKGYPAGFVIDVVAEATNALGGKYYMTAHSYNNSGKSAVPFATNGFNAVDCKDYVAPKPKPEPTPTPQPETPKLIKGLKFNRYELPIRVVTMSDVVKLWDYNYNTWGDISAHPVDTFAKGKEIDIVGDVTHPLGGVYLVTGYSLGSGDVKDPNFKPHKTWGINVVDVKEIEVLPAPEPMPEPQPQPEPETPGEDMGGEGPTNAGAGDLLQPVPGETALSYWQRFLQSGLGKAIMELLSKFKFGG